MHGVPPSPCCRHCCCCCGLFQVGSRADGTVTWSNPDQCQAYVKRLQVAAERVASENRTLRKMHQRLAEVGND